LLQSSPWLLVLLPCLGFTVLYYIVSLRVNAFTADFDLRAHRRLVQDWRPKTYPTVAVFLPVCGEPVDVLRNSWTHVHGLADRYPGKATPSPRESRGSPSVPLNSARPNGCGWSVSAPLPPVP
jgi:cellulose synthase (UDP-forming)